MRNISVGKFAFVAILLVILGAASPKYLVLGAIAVGVFILIRRFRPMACIHIVLQQVPLVWQSAVWLVLTAIAFIGAITYYTSGVPARFINCALYIVTLGIAILYATRKVAEHAFFKTCTWIWSVLTIACIWKLIPFVGWLLAIVDIVLLWHFHYIADKTNQPQSQQHQQQPTTTNVINNLTDHSSRKSVEHISTGTINWNFYPKDESGEICSFTPLTWCYIPAFWRKIQFVKNGREILVVEKLWFHLKSRTNLGLIYDPDFVEGSEEWLISFICRNMQIRLISGGKTRDGKHAPEIRFRLPNNEADLVVSCIDVLIQETCDFQGLKRLGRI